MPHVLHPFVSEPRRRTVRWVRRDRRLARAAFVAGVVSWKLVVSANGDCELQDVFLRSLADAHGNAMPIDVYPVPGDQLRLRALMDYGMSGFQMEVAAAPFSHCSAQLTGPPTVMVDAGSSVLAEVSVHDALSDATLLYNVNVSRLSGKETSLMSVQMQDAEFVPAWNPITREYSAYLSVTQDLIKLTYQALDNGQLVTLVASPQAVRSSADMGRRLASDTAYEPTALLAALPRSAAAGAGPPIGEVQRSPATLMSSIDAGRDRLVELVVMSADSSVQKSYKFAVQRPNCPADQRFFDGLAKACTDICNEGYFGNHATGRCTECLQENCLVCDTKGLGCSMCRDGYVLGGDGCTNVLGAFARVGEVEEDVQRFERKHRILVLAAASAAIVAALACAVLACTGKAGFGFGFHARVPRLLDSDDDDPEEDGLSTSRKYYGD